MDQERAGLQYDALVVRAISAAVWPLSRMDRVFFSPAAAAGAAVAFTHDIKTGQVEVDAKFNAAITAQVAAAAESHGQPGCVYRAMMLKDARLYRWRDKDGVHLSSESPSGANAEEIDSENTVLAWTAQQAAESGFGAMAPSSDPASLGPLLSATHWTSAGDLPAQVNARWVAELARDEQKSKDAEEAITTARKSVVEVAKRLIAQMTTARNAEPSKVVELYYHGSGSITPDSQAKWRERTDRAVGEWNTVHALLADLEKAERHAGHAVDDYNAAFTRECAARLYDGKPDPLVLDPVEHHLDAKAIRKEADDTIRRLNAERSKNRL
jgi:hypothetical protein